MRNKLLIFQATVIIALSSTVYLAGCSRKPANEEVTGPVSQVIAHVGTDAITAQELENEFRLANVRPDKLTDAVTKDVLGQIVVRKYLAQQALAAKLDREPTVHLDIMRAREQVLGSAMMQRSLLPKVSSIGKSEIDQFIAAHPSQFAKREILNIEQIIIPTSAETQALVDDTKNFKTLDQVDQKLTEMGISHTRSAGILDSGNIPDEFLAVLEAKNKDDVFFARAASNGKFFKVTGEKSEPLTGDDAANRARQMLQLDALKSASQQTARAAEASAKFLGDYAKIMGTQAPEKEASPAKQ